MNVYDLIFMACLSLAQGNTCKQNLLKCTIDKRDTQLQEFLSKTDFKKLTPEEFLNAQPQADWPGWVLDCSQAMPYVSSNIKPETDMPKTAPLFFAH